MKKVVYVLIIALLLVGFMACGNNTEEPSEPMVDEVEVTLYYANNEYIVTGDEKYDRLVPIKKAFLKDDSNLYLTVLKELQNPPAQENAMELYPEIELLDVTIEDKIAYVNISRENLHGGSMQEGFFIDQIVYTLTEFEEIEKVQFLVDGQITESLMGHYTADMPLSR